MGLSQRARVFVDERQVDCRSLLACVCVCMCMLICVCVCVCVYTYIHTYSQKRGSSHSALALDYQTDFWEFSTAWTWANPRRTELLLSLSKLQACPWEGPQVSERVCVCEREREMHTIKHGSTGLLIYTSLSTCIFYILCVEAPQVSFNVYIVFVEAPQVSFEINSKRAVLL